MLIATSIAIILGGQLAHAETPLVAAGNIEASVKIISGTELTPKGAVPSKDVMSELDGTTLELGNFQCKVTSGKCVFENLKPGTYIPAAQLDVKTEGIAYKLAGSNAGTLVLIKPGKKQGQLEIGSSGDSKIVFIVERVLDSTPKPQPPPPPRDLSKLDLSFKFEIWIRVLDEGESGSHERRARTGELDGSILHLGKAACTINGETCAFPEVFRGTHKLTAEIKNPDPQKQKIELSPDTPEFTVLLDSWHRPRVKGWPKVVSVIFLKTRLRK